jgi:hypothetical protein
MRARDTHTHMFIYICSALYFAMFCSGFEDPYKWRNSIHMYVLTGLNHSFWLISIGTYTKDWCWLVEWTRLLTSVSLTLPFSEQT